MLLSAAPPDGPQPSSASYDFTPDPTSPPDDGGDPGTPPPTSPPDDGSKVDKPSATANPNGGDPIVTDNPAIPQTGQNLTVVVIGGDPSERLAWANQARQYYGPGAYIITDVHSVADLGNKLAQFPNESIGSLVAGGHGNAQGMQLGDPGNLATKLSSATLANDPTALNKITLALGPNASLDIQACQCAADPTEQQNLANTLGTTVRAAKNNLSGSTWNDPNGQWVTVSPK